METPVSAASWRFLSWRGFVIIVAAAGLYCAGRAAREFRSLTTPLHLDIPAAETDIQRDQQMVTGILSHGLPQWHRHWDGQAPTPLW